jgi:hypothetical protein
VTRPQRIQRKRAKGWRMPEGAIYVGRPGRWGNPFRVGSTSERIAPHGIRVLGPHSPMTAQDAVESCRNWILADARLIASIRLELAGRDLACWCPLDQPCHADVLLELANPAKTTEPVR